MAVASIDEVLAVLDRAPFAADKRHTHSYRRSGARAILGWLSGFDGQSWQERWEASPASPCPKRWRQDGEALVNTADAATEGIDL